MSELTLDLDVGNSRTKWRVLGVATGCLKNEEIDRLQNAIVYRPSRIRVASVLDEVYETILSDSLQKIFHCEPEFARPTLSCSGMFNGYRQPSMLGVDRWLASLSVWGGASGPCLVIDAGSALTIDTVDDQGVFRGGYIMPGLVMMQQSLISNTGRIECNVQGGICKDFDSIPIDTEQAVQRGSCFAIIATIEKAIRDFLLRWPHGTVRITGGTGADIAAIMEMQDKYRSDLVLDGLALALP